MHCTSALLFPAGYAAKYGITLKGPDDNANFDWDTYLKNTGAASAQEKLFDPVPNNLDQMFKVGARLEAVDQLEPNLIVGPFPAQNCIE
jgi:hypothetical protein